MAAASGSRCVSRSHAPERAGVATADRRRLDGCSRRTLSDGLLADVRREQPAGQVRQLHLGVSTPRRVDQRGTSPAAMRPASSFVYFPPRMPTPSMGDVIRGDARTRPSTTTASRRPTLPAVAARIFAGAIVSERDLDAEAGADRDDTSPGDVAVGDDDPRFDVDRPSGGSIWHRTKVRSWTCLREADLERNRRVHGAAVRATRRVPVATPAITSATAEASTKARRDGACREARRPPQPRRHGAAWHRAPPDPANGLSRSGSASARSSRIVVIACRLSMRRGRASVRAGLATDASAR